jgi:hypothetical protein
MRTNFLACLPLLCAVVGCSDSLAPANDAFGDIVSLQLSAGFGQQTYWADSTSKFWFVARNNLPRDVTIYGAGCIITLELQNMQGVTVFPSGAPVCLPPLETFRVFAHDSTVGSINFGGARGNPANIGTFALPAGTFRMRVVLEGVSDTYTYNPVRLATEWSDPFNVLP